MPPVEPADTTDADYYFVEYGNEALKLQKGIASYAVSPIQA